MHTSRDQFITREIKQRLSESGLSQGVVCLIESWLEANLCLKGKYGWADLTLLICESTGGSIEAGVAGAAAIELYALAADILDDIQDQDNNSLPWRKVPPAQATNLAVSILVLSYNILSVPANRRHFESVSNVFNQMGLQACDGQFQDFLNDPKEKITLEEYFAIIKKKSGVLTASACKIGAILGDADQGVISRFEEFGMNLGVISQIKNDLNDFLNLETKSDFIQGRKTLPFVYLLNVLKGIKAEELKYLSSLASKGFAEFGPKERAQLRELVLKEGTIQYCSVLIEMYKQRAFEVLAGIPISETRKEKLIQLV